MEKGKEVVETLTVIQIFSVPNDTEKVNTCLYGKDSILQASLSNSLREQERKNLMI